MSTPACSWRCQELFALLTSFFFLRSGMNVSLSLVWANLGLLAAKSAAVYPLARRWAAPHAGFTTLLMSTGLTFGTISATYGLTAGIITRAQFSVLVTVVVMSAVLSTAIAQRFFHPEPGGTDDRGAPVLPRRPHPQRTPRTVTRLETQRLAACGCAFREPASSSSGGPRPQTVKQPSRPADQPEQSARVR